MPFDTTLDPTTDVILGTIDYIETHGWVKGAAARGAERCIVYAMRAVAGAHSHILDLAEERVKMANGITTDLPFWNDVKERTKEQVIEALRNTLVFAPETVG